MFRLPRNFISKFSSIALAAILVLTGGALPASATDSTAPFITSRILDLNGTTLTLNFSEPLELRDSGDDGNSTGDDDIPLNGFSLTADGVTIGLTPGVIASGATSLVLTLASAIQSDSDIRLSYNGTANQIEDLGNNDLAAITPTVENVTGGASPAIPTVSSIALNGSGDQITVTFSELMRASSVTTGFSLTVETVTLSSPFTSAAMAAGSNTLTLNLSTALQSNNDIRLSYSGTSIQDLAGNNLAAIAPTSENVTGGATPAAPTFTAALSGQTITLTFSENMRAEQFASASGFSVTANSAAIPITSTGTIAAGGTTLTLTLGRTLQSDSDIRLTYTFGTVLYDLQGTAVLSVTPSSENVSGGATPTDPTISSASLTSGNQINLTFSEPMEERLANAIGTGRFSVTVGGLSKTISSVGTITAAGTGLVITLAENVVSTATVVLTYTTSADNIEDLVGNDVATQTISVTNNSGTSGDSVGPLIQTATLGSDGVTLTIIFDEAMAGATQPAGFSVVSGSSTQTPTGASIGNIAAGTSQLTLTLATAIEQGAAVRLTYSGSTLEDLAGNNLSLVNNPNPQTASTGLVNNNSTVDTTRPTVISAQVNASGTTLTVTFSEGMEARAAVTPAASAAHGLSVTIGGEAVTISSAEFSNGATSMVLTFGGGITVPSTADVILSYAGGDALEDDSTTGVAGGNDLSFSAPTITFASPSTVVNVAPTVLVAALSTFLGANGTTLTVAFSEPMENRSAVATAASAHGLSVTVNGSAREISAAAITGNASQIVLTLSSAAQTGEVVVLSYAAGAGLQDRFGANLASTGLPLTVTNNSLVDTVRPTVTGASLNSAGSLLTITFSEGMEARSTGALSGFTVRVGGVSVPFSYNTEMTSGATTLVLTITTPIQSGAPVTLDFATSADLIEDDDLDTPNDLDTFNGFAVQNNSTVAGDTTVPNVQSAILDSDGRTLTLTFTDTMAAKTSVSLAGSFTVTVGGVSRTVQTVGSIAASGTTLVLTLATPAVETGATVRFGFAGGANVVEDLAGNDLAAVTAGTGLVTNNSTVAAVAPTATAALGTNGTTLTLTFSEDMKSATAPTGFTVTVGGVSVPFTAGNITGGGTTLVLTLTTAVQAGNTVQVNYTTVANQIEDLASVDLASLTALAVTNNSSVTAAAPTVTSRTVNAAGTTLTLTFSENMEARTPATGFTVLVGGTAVSATIGNISSAGTSLDLTLANVIQQGAVVTVSFAGGADQVEDLAQNDMAAFTGAAVTNNSTVTTVTVTFNSNYTGGAAATTQTVNAGVATALTSNTFTRTGYTFAGWNTAANGSGTSYANAASLTTNSAVTLFAQWTAVVQTITYRANGASGTVPVQAGVGTDGTFTLATAANLSRPGFTFAGWSDGAATYQPGATYTVGSAAVTLTAQWTTPSAVGTPVALPTNVVGSAGNASATVTWQITVGAGELTPVSYVVEFSTDGGTTWSGATATGTGLSRTVTGLRNGTSYVFRVTAVATNSTATSAQSAAVTPVDPTPVVVPDPVSPTKRVTVGTFNGFIAIYTVGYEGSRMTARVAGRWLTVNPITNVAGKNYSLTRRNTGAGFNVNVQVYIDGQLITSTQVRTR